MKTDLLVHNKSKIIRLLPNHFKWVGLSVIILVGLFFLVAKAFFPEFVKFNRQILFDLAPRIFLLGLLIFSLSKDKIEDELISLVRLKALGFTFILVSLIAIIEPVTNLIWKENIINLTTPHLVLRMLIAYLIVFFFLKKLR